MDVGPVSHTLLVVVVGVHVNGLQRWQVLSLGCSVVYPTWNLPLHARLHVLPEIVVDFRPFVLRSGVRAFV